MGRKLKGKLNKKGLMGALARHSVQEETRTRISKAAEAKREQKILKEKSMKSGGLNKKQQHRQQQQQQHSGLVPFTHDNSLLLVGEGDFSYAVALVQENLINPKLLVATSFDSLEEVNSKYPDAEQNLKILKEEGVQVLHDIDATDLAITLKVVSATKKKVLKSTFFKDRKQLDYVMFNFPHTGRGMKDVDRNIRDHQQLVHKYFQSCKELFSVINNDAKNDFAGYANAAQTTANHGRAVLSLFNGEPYDSWTIKILARDNGFRLERSGRFDWEKFPGYHHKRTNGVRDTTKPASERQARVYVFEKWIKDEDKTKKVVDSDDE